MLETLLINTNFIVLVILTLYYWLNVLNFLPTLPLLRQGGIMISQLLQFSFLCFRFVSSGHYPLSNLYESILFLSWLLTVVLLVLNQMSSYKKSQQPFLFNTFWQSMIGSIMMPCILLLNTFALFSLPAELKQTTALVPALQSNWLVMHVTVMILSYATLIAGCLLSMAFLVFDLFYSKPIDLKLGLKTSTEASENQSLNLNIKPISSFLDSLSYRLLGFGFTFLTIGLLSGSIWANQTWGSYWSWDPKETWALITWFIFAIYLHTRLSQGWAGRNSAQLATFGFFILWICYLGVNLMGKGLHSYGFLT